MLRQRQKAILTFLYDYHHQYGFSPTIREIGAGVGVNSTSVVKYNLTRLMERGYLVGTNRRSRTTRLTEKGYEALSAIGRYPAKIIVEDEAVEIQRLKAQIARLQRTYQSQLEAVQQERDALWGELVNLRTLSHS